MITENDYPNIEVDIKDNFPDLTDEDRTQILEWFLKAFEQYNN